MRHLQRLDELINRVVREAELIHDYVQLRFHGGLVLTLNNAVELDGQMLSNSPAGRILLAPSSAAPSTMWHVPPIRSS